MPQLGRIPPAPTDLTASRTATERPRITTAPGPTIAPTQKDETLQALQRSRARTSDLIALARPRVALPAPTGRADVVPVHVREENPRGDGIIVTLREGHWVEKPRRADGGPAKVQLGLHTGKPVLHHIEDQIARAHHPDSVEIDGQTVERTGDAGLQARVLAAQLRRLRRGTGETTAAQNTDPRTPEGAAWLRNEWAKVCERVTDPASRPRKEVIDWIVSGKLPEKTARSGQDTYWEHIFLRYCGGEHLPLDLERNYSRDLRWSYIGEWNATGKGHPAIHTSATLLNDKLAGTGYDVYETKFMPVGDRLCVTELWGYRDDKIKHNQVTDGVDTFWIETGEITHKMISLTVTDADGNPRDYYRKIGQPFPPDEEFERNNLPD